MMECKKSILNESQVSLRTNNQQQPSSNRASSKKRKFEISKDELKNGDFDQIVVETSALVTNNLRALKASIKIEYEQQDMMSFGTPDQSAGSCIGPDGQPKRPMNAFMVWGQAIRRELHNKFSNVQNAILSKALGRVWKRLDTSEKEPYITRANIIKSNHKRDYPNYRYQPRRIQEKQRRLQQSGHNNDININHNYQQHLKQLQQSTNQQQHNELEARFAQQEVPKNTTTTTGLVAAAPHTHLPYDDLIVASQPINPFVAPQPGRNNSANVFKKGVECNEDELWMKPAPNYVWCNGNTGVCFQPEQIEFGASNKFNLQDDKYFRYADEQTTINEHLESEYHLPSSESDISQTVHDANDIQNQVSTVDNQARLFYGTSNEHLKRPDAELFNQSVLGALCMESQPQSSQQLTVQDNNSLNIYNSNYRQQYQPQQELAQELTHQIQLQQQLESHHFGQYRQSTGNEQVRYQDQTVRYQAQSLGHQNHNQQQHLYLRQINDVTHSNNYGPYRTHAQAENYQNCRRIHTDEICPVL